MAGRYQDRIIDRNDRKRLTLFSDSHWDRLEKRGETPRRVQIGPGRVGWWLSEVMEWLKAKPRGSVKGS